MRAVCVGGLIVAYREVPEFHKRRHRRYGNQDWSDHPVDCFLLFKLEERIFHPLRPPTDTLSCEGCTLISPDFPRPRKKSRPTSTINRPSRMRSLKQPTFKEATIMKQRLSMLGMIILPFCTEDILILKVMVFIPFTQNNRF